MCFNNWSPVVDTVLVSYGTFRRESIVAGSRLQEREGFENHSPITLPALSLLPYLRMYKPVPPPQLKAPPIALPSLPWWTVCP